MVIAARLERPPRVERAQRRERVRAVPVRRPRLLALLRDLLHVLRRHERVAVRQDRRERERVVQALEEAAVQHEPPHLHIDRELQQHASERRQVLLRVQRANHLQVDHRSGHALRLGRLDRRGKHLLDGHAAEIEGLDVHNDVAQVDALHLHGLVRVQQLRVRLANDAEVLARPVAACTASALIKVR